MYHVFFDTNDRYKTRDKRDAYTKAVELASQHNCSVTVELWRGGDRPDQRFMVVVEHFG